MSKDKNPSPQTHVIGNNPYHREPSENAREVALQAAADANDGYINGKTKRSVIAALNAFGDPTGNVAALKWSRSGWVEAFAKPEGLGLWYSIQPDKPVHGPGDPPFTCSVIWGEPGQNMRECLGSDFQTLETAKSAAQADFNKRIQSVLSPSPETSEAKQ